MSRTENEFQLSYADSRVPLVEQASACFHLNFVMHIKIQKKTG